MTLWIAGTGGLVMTESHSGNAATYTLTPSSGADYPLSFFDGSEAVVPATGISLTIPAGATLDVINTNGFRLWFAIFNNAGTPILAVRRCTHIVSPPTAVASVSPPEHLVANVVGIDGFADLPHTFYGSAVLASKPWVWIAFATYESSLGTPGNWNVSPNLISYITVSTPRPGAVLQQLCNQNSITVNISTPAASLSISQLQIQPSSGANFIETSIGCSYIYLRPTSAGANGRIYVQNISTGRTVSTQTYYTNTNAESLSTGNQHGYDTLVSLNAVTYQTVAQYVNNNTGTIQFQVSDFHLKEIMG
jgi:hypothetical protein